MDYSSCLAYLHNATYEKHFQVDTDEKLALDAFFRARTIENVGTHFINVIRSGDELGVCMYAC